jgi:hypothetical protein
MTSDSTQQKLCFVVMGFGKKTDYPSGRTLDLDATYEEIIQPAVEAANLRCIRANEIFHSGVIDEKMYDMLLRADLVIADISTGNVNAVYELGVRHALKPFSTIIMKEDKGELHFDLNHVSTFRYEHLETDIGSKEARRATSALKKLIEETLNKPQKDSPVYTFLPNLIQPALTEQEFEEVLEDAEEVQESFSNLLSRAEAASKASDHSIAAESFKELLELRSSDSYLRQQCALHIYKAELPSETMALISANTLLEPLKPITSNDPETLGISGAIHKRLWKLTGDIETLNTAITLYSRGFDVRGDYYNGENAATCLDIRSNIQREDDEALFDRMSAKKIRESIIEKLNEVINQNNFEDRSDQKWIFATLANCYFSLNNVELGNTFEEKFYQSEPAEWETKTYLENKSSTI